MLVIFYFLGYATSNVVGLMVEKCLAFGMIILKIFSLISGKEMVKVFRDEGQPVTVFDGEGEAAFYVIEQARDVNKILKPVMTLVGGWRQRHKRK